MKEYFVKLFSYDRFENIALLNAIATANNPSKKAIELMAHLLTAQQRWISRCKGVDAEGGLLWPQWPLDGLAMVADENYAAWINYVNTLTDIDFETRIAYKDTRNVPHADKLVDILTHVINHGTHHRAQIGQQLKFAGVEHLPMTDYIFYIRNL